MTEPDDTRPLPKISGGRRPTDAPRSDASAAGAARPGTPRADAAQTGEGPQGSENVQPVRTAQPLGPSQAKRLLGLTRPAGSPKRVAERIARKAVDRIINHNAPSTEPIPIVATLKGTPYQGPVEPAAKSQDEARMILDLAADIGAIMLRAGASSTDVEISVIATCSSLGLPNAEVDLTSNSLTVHYSDPDGRFLTVLRVNRAESFHFAKLGSVHALIADMADGHVDYLEARERIDAIRVQRRPFTEFLVTGAWGVLASALVLLLGGGYVAALLGFSMAVLNDRLGRILARTGMPPFFAVLSQAAFTTFVAMLAWTFDVIANPQYLVASGIILLLPTQNLIAAVQDSLTDFPLTAASRMVKVVMVMAGIVSGIALGLMTGRVVGLSPIEVVVDATGVEVLTTIIALVSSLFVAATATVCMQGSRRFILPGAVVGISGFIVMVGCSLLGLGTIFTSLVSATVVGLLARPIALHRGAPPIVLIIPGIYPLLQGLSIFSSVYEIVMPDELVSLSTGLSSLFAAIMSNAALGAGVVLGDFLVRPLFKRRRRMQSSGEPPVDLLGAE